MTSHRQSQSPAASAASEGEIRLIQAYLRALGAFGDPNTIRGVDVVNGSLTPKTRDACERQLAAMHDRCILSTDEDVAHVIATLRRAHSAIANASRGVDDSLAERSALTRAFEASTASSRYPILIKLHPQMRFALAAALDTLAQRGVTVVIHEGYRPPEKQETLVMQGRSTAVPYWSLHGYGLAIDITPHSNNTDAALNPKSKAWQTIFAVMKQYGFDSLYQLQGWDVPHFELPVKTATLRDWPTGADGFKDIPDHALPAMWRRINADVISGQLANHKQGMQR
jgi:uncharacterized protein YcbK (DUF882 family)